MFIFRPWGKEQRLESNLGSCKESKEVRLGSSRTLAGIDGGNVNVNVGLPKAKITHVVGNRQRHLGIQVKDKVDHLVTP